MFHYVTSKNLNHDVVSRAKIWNGLGPNINLKKIIRVLFKKKLNMEMLPSIQQGMEVTVGMSGADESRGLVMNIWDNTWYHIQFYSDSRSRPRDLVGSIV